MHRAALILWELRERRGGTYTVGVVGEGADRGDTKELARWKVVKDAAFEVRRHTGIVC